MDRFTHRYRERIGDATGEFGKKTAAIVREDATPKTIHVDGDDRSFGASRDGFHAAADGSETPGARELPFREDANEITVGNAVRSASDSIARVFTGDGDRIENFQDPAK